MEMRYLEKLLTVKFVAAFIPNVQNTEMFPRFFPQILKRSHLECAYKHINADYASLLVGTLLPLHNF